MKDSEEETADKITLLKLRGWQFLFYPAEMCEALAPGEIAGDNLGHFFGTWVLPDKVHWFYEKEFGDG